MAAPRGKRAFVTRAFGLSLAALVAIAAYAGGAAHGTDAGQPAQVDAVARRASHLATPPGAKPAAIAKPSTPRRAASMTRWLAVVGALLALFVLFLRRNRFIERVFSAPSWSRNTARPRGPPASPRIPSLSQI
jgi:hypothetical protein